MRSANGTSRTKGPLSGDAGPGPTGRTGGGSRDLTVLAVPLYFGGMALEHLWLKRRAVRRGPSAGDYERRDTVASLAMGTGSLMAPFLVPRLLRPFIPGRGRYGRTIVAVALGAAAVTTGADFVARRSDRPVAHPGKDDGAPEPSRDGTGPAGVGLAATRRPVARRVASVGGVTAVVAGGVAAVTGWASVTTAERLWRRRLTPSLGAGPVTVALAVIGWDFIYYWNHRFMHESRYMWAVHVVHHSSEHYNLSTALRQPVADALGTALPYSSLCLFGIPPELVMTARGVNLLYQFWIHTESIGRLGAPEAVLNSPSHHRVHHGSNAQYLDRNHGSILIVWDRLFGTFEPEGQPVEYGLTRNIDTFNVGRIAAHEYTDMLADVARSTSWRERLSFVVRGPGWARRHREELAGPSVPTSAHRPVSPQIDREPPPLPGLTTPDRRASLARST